MDGFAQDPVAQAGLDCVGDYEVHFAVEEPFQKALQVHVGVEGLSFQLDNEVQVARLPIFPARSRTEEREAANAETAELVRSLSMRMRQSVSEFSVDPPC